MNQDNKKSSFFIFPITFFFIIVRAVIFSTEELIGYNFDKQQALLSYTSVMFWLLILLCGLLSAVLALNVFKKYGNNAWIPCTLLIADPVFLLNQKFLSFLFIYIFWLFYLNCCFMNKNSLKNLSAFLFLFVAAVVSPEMTLGFFALIVLIELLSTVNREKNKITYITQFLFILVTIVGIISSKPLNSNISEVKHFTVLINMEQFAETEKILAVLILSLPSLIFGALFFSVFSKKHIPMATRKKKSQKRKNSYKTILNIISFAFILLFAGSIFGGYETLCTLPLFIPVIILVLLSTDKARTDSSLTDISNFIINHSAASVSILISVYYLCIRFYLSQFGGYMIANFFIVNR